MDHQPALPEDRPKSISHIARSTLLIAVFFAIDKALGLLRQIVVGRQFGVGSNLDAFNAANNIPDLLFALISGGALSVAFIPVLSQSLQKEGRQALWALFSRVANIAFLVTGLVSLLVALFAAPLVRAELGVAPGLNPQLQALIANLMRLNLIATLLFSLSGLVSAGLQSNQHFLLPALAPVVYDVGQIFGALVLAPEEGYRIGGLQLPAAGLGVYGLVYGVILGAAFHLAIQVPGLLRYRFRWTPKIGLDHPGVRRVARLMLPRIVSIGAFQIVFWLQDNLASRLAGAGSITALAYGWLIMQVPETVIATALGIALLPTMSEHFARGDEAGFESGVTRAIRSLLALTIPATVLLMVTIRPLVQAAFRFDAHGTELVVWAARAYLIGLVGHSLLEVVARAFYARQNALLPMLAAGIRTLVFVVLGVLLYRSVGAAGIALSNGLAFSVEAVFLLGMLARSYPGIVRHGRALARIAGGSALGALLAYGAVTQSALAPLLAGLLGLTVGGLATLPFIWPDVRDLLHL